jgi:hypothetical protein
VDVGDRAREVTQEHSTPVIGPTSASEEAG